MSWNLTGTYFETCSCDVICPCTASLSHGATHDRCRVVLVFNVKSGEVDGTDVGGVTVAASASPSISSGSCIPTTEPACKLSQSPLSPGPCSIWLG